MEERERLSGKKWNYNMRRWKLMGRLMEIVGGDGWGDGEEMDGRWRRWMGGGRRWMGRWGGDGWGEGGDGWGDGEEIDGGMKEMEGRMEEMNEDGGDGR